MHRRRRKDKKEKERERERERQREPYIDQVRDTLSTTCFPEPLCYSEAEDTTHTNLKSKETNTLRNEILAPQPIQLTQALPKTKNKETMT